MGDGGGVGSASGFGIDQTSAMTAPVVLEVIGSGADTTGLMIVVKPAEPAQPPTRIHPPRHSKRTAPQRGKDTRKGVGSGRKRRKGTRWQAMGGYRMGEVQKVRRWTQRGRHYDSAAPGSGRAHARREDMRHAGTSAYSSDLGLCVGGAQQRLQRDRVLREWCERVIAESAGCTLGQAGAVDLISRLILQ